MKVSDREALKYLVVLEFIIFAVILPTGYYLHNSYFRGVGIGLLISWVTGGLAYWRIHSSKKK